MAGVSAGDKHQKQSHASGLSVLAPEFCAFWGLWVKGGWGLASEDSLQHATDWAQRPEQCGTTLPDNTYSRREGDWVARREGLAG